MTSRRTTAFAVGVAGCVAALAIGAAPASLASAAPDPGASDAHHHRGSARYVVRLDDAKAITALSQVVKAGGGKVIAQQKSVGTVVVEVNDATAAKLAKVAGVHNVTEDYTVKSQSLGFAPAGQPGALTNVTRLTGANAAWTAGYTGDGIDVALIDTGVAPVAALKDAAKVVVGPDLSFESQDPDLTFLDTYGHGTHMAGIIAGREVAKGSGSSYAADSTNFYGMAPDSRLVSLKIADNQGAVDVSQMIAAIDWVVQNKSASGLNIKVLNLSYGSASPQSPDADPLSWAAEVAWKSGITVVVSVGNDGDSVPGLSNPSYNPWVIAVGAADTKGTDVRTDDVVPSFSARQGGNWGTRNPDLVAPGVSIISAMPVNSNIYLTYAATAKIGNDYFKGSGTSQATAVVSGAVADLLQAHPSWTPNQVKAVLKATAVSLPGQAGGAQGSGEINLAAALTATPGTVQSQVNGNGTGSLESARGGYHVSLDGQLLQGEIDIMGKNWNNNQTAADALARTAIKADGTFNTGGWTGSGFIADTTSWAGKTWQGRTWQGRTWQGAWAGKTWQGRTWQSKSWQTGAWSTGSWGSLVGSPGWSSQIWSGSKWG